MTLTHNVTLDWADAALDTAKHGGLTPFGKEVVREMNRLGMLVDLSHVSPGTMSDALTVTEAPVIFSHSGARGLVNHPRDVPDSILRRVTVNGGIVMVPFVAEFVSPAAFAHDSTLKAYAAEVSRRYPEDSASQHRALLEWQRQHPTPAATLGQVADQIEYIRKVAGVDHVGIGGDLDGGGGVPGLNEVSDYPALVTELARRGWSEADLRKVVGENLLRVFAQAEVVAARLQRERPPSTATIRAARSSRDSPLTWLLELHSHRALLATRYPLPARRPRRRSTLAPEDDSVHNPFVARGISVTSITAALLIIGATPHIRVSPDLPAGTESAAARSHHRHSTVHPANPADVALVDAIVKALYDVISGPPGQARDWNRFLSLFAPGARLIPTHPCPTGGGNGIQVISAAEFAARGAAVLAKTGFYERGIHSKIDRFGDIAQVFTTYESWHSMSDPKPFARGINSMQFFFDGKRWWCVTIFWDAEHVPKDGGPPTNPIPAQYLPK